MWNNGVLVAVTGQAFAAALSLPAGAQAREGEINQRLTGRPLRVRGRLRRTHAGVTAIMVGLETQNSSRGVATVTGLSVPLPTVGSWADFEGWITPASDQVWARPYIAATGSAGAVELGEIHIERGASGLSGRGDLVAGDVTNSWPLKASALISVSHAPTVGLLIFEKTITTRGGPLEVIVSMDLQLSSGQDLDILIYLDATYAGGATPTGYRRKSTIKTGTSNTMRAPYTVHEPIGDPQNIAGDPPPAAGSHTVRVYVRNATNAGVNIDDRTLQIREFANDPAL
jgi:hypothetical protein